MHASDTGTLEQPRLHINRHHQQQHDYQTGMGAASNDQPATMVQRHLCRVIRLRNFLALDLGFQRMGAASIHYSCRKQRICL